MDADCEHEARARRVALNNGGGEMAFLDFGPPARPVDVIFSHANGFNARTYRTILSPLAHELRILAIDLRGHGASTLPTAIESHGWGVFGDDLLALLAALAEGPVVLAGHSMGATTSLLAAAKAPDRVRRLVMFDPAIIPELALSRPGMPSEPTLAQGALRRRASFGSKQAAFDAYLGRGAFKTWTPAQVADYVEAGFRKTEAGVTLSCAPAWEAANFRSHNYDPWAAFSDTRCPIDIFRAAEQSTCLIEEREAELVGQGRIRIETVAGATHFLPMERPDLVRAALRAVVAEH